MLKTFTVFFQVRMTVEAHDEAGARRAVEDIISDIDDPFDDTRVDVDACVEWPRESE